MSTDNYFIRILDKKISKEEFTQSEILQDACGTDDKGKLICFLIYSKFIVNMNDAFINYKIGYNQRL